MSTPPPGPQQGSGQPTPRRIIRRSASAKPAEGAASSPPVTMVPPSRTTAAGLGGLSATAGPPPRHPESATARRTAATQGGSSAAPPRSPTTVASVSTTAGFEGPRAKLVIDRNSFSSINFSAPTFVNNVSNRVLYPVLLRHQQQQQQQGDRRGGGAGGTTSDAAGGDASGVGGLLRGSDGMALFSSSNIPMSARQTDSAAAVPVDYPALAAQISRTLGEATAEISKLLAEEDQRLQRQEVRCKRVEIKEKRQLGTIRVGLEATSGHLQEYENRVSNAQAATAGIEQHLSQSNARVQRGKSVSQLLRFFKMFTALQPVDLSGMLKALSKARVAQRTAVTDKWEHGSVSPFNPRYFTTVVNQASVFGDDSVGASHVMARSATSTTEMIGVSGGMEDSPGQSPSQSATNRQVKTKAVFRKGATRAASQQRSHSGEAPMSRGRVGSAPGSRSSSVSRGASTTTRRGSGTSSVGGTMGRGDSGGAGGFGGDDEHGEDDNSAADEDSSDEDDDDDLFDDAHLSRVKLHRAEAAAVAAGLDRLFAVRSYTEAQVEWCQKLQLLATEVGDLAANTKNVDAYITWLRQELVSDLFHVIGRFDDFYDQNPHTAVHVSYGRALLKTLELISRLYTTITPSNDALLTVFFSRSINDLGVTLFSEYSPRPLPAQPQLPQPTPLLAMDHYNEHTKEDLRKTFDFLMDRLRRDVIVVETIFGMTSTARQQLLAKVTEGVVKPFIMQQVKLAETHKTTMLHGEATLSPRSKLRCATRVADAIAYHHTVEVRLFAFFEYYVKELRKSFDDGEADFLQRFAEGIFIGRAEYSTSHAELDLLSRYHLLIENKYTRHLHAVADEFFDLRESHMAKMKEMIDRLNEVATRVKRYALPKDVGPYIFDLIQASLKAVGTYLDTELRKTYDSIRTDRDNWKLRPKSEDELLKPSKPESQQCGFRMLLFSQSSLMSFNDTIAVICMPLLNSYPRLVQDVEDARASALEALDERAEKLLNLCAQAIIIRSLAILLHYQNKSDYAPKEVKNSELDAVAPPCTRACTLFCYYVTRQFEEAKEFIRLSNGQIPQRQTASQIASGATLGNLMQQSKDPGGTAAGSGSGVNGGGMNKGVAGMMSMMVSSATSMSSAEAVRARARTMSLQQLLYGDGGPSSFVRTVGVCLYRGIAAHLKSFVANDRGALVYKQDVTAYKEAMAPLTSTPGLGGAEVEVLFQMLKETSSLLIMPLDHIKEVKESGTLKLMSNDEKIRYIKIRQDVRDAFRVINQ